MKEVCNCGNKTANPKPPKYSPDDPYGAYRRRAKDEMQAQKLHKTNNG